MNNRTAILTDYREVMETQRRASNQMDGEPIYWTPSEAPAPAQAPRCTIGDAILTIFCTVHGWVGLAVLGAVVYAWIH